MRKSRGRGGREIAGKVGGGRREQRSFPGKPEMQGGRTWLFRVPINSSTGLKIDGNLVALHFKYDQARRRFVEWAQNEIAVVPDFHKRILFSGEAHFWLNGYVNKQNCRIWSEANPQVYVETPLHPEKLTVWCALWAGGILLQKR
ncbi:putative transposable element [Trichonephila clavipes]|nr:putative transposable element [Trichonephila clavipes]